MQHPDAKFERPATTRLAESIIEHGVKAFDPRSTSSPEERQAVGETFNQLINSARTWHLVQSLNALVKPGASPSYLRPELIKILTLIPLRPDGVRATFEFIFSVHPSNESLTKSEEATVQKRGASITHEATAIATRLLSTIPDSTTPQAWIDAIAPQLLGLLDGKDGDDLAKVAAQVIAFGILGRRQLGSPGSPGWRAFVDPILRSIHPSIMPNWRSELDRETETLDVINLSQDLIAVTADELHLALRRLYRLLHSSPSPGLCRRLVSPILLDLWALSIWPAAQPTTKENYGDLAYPILKMYIKISSPRNISDAIIRDLLYIGDSAENQLLWKFHQTAGGEIDIVVSRTPEVPPQVGVDWSIAEVRAKALARLLVETCTPEDISVVFGKLFETWVSSKVIQPTPEVIVKSEEYESSKDPTNGLVGMMVLRQLMEQATDKLVSKVDQLLGLVCQVLDANTRQPQEEEVMSVTLSILSQVVLDPNFQRKTVQPRVLELIEEALARISNEGSEELSRTARNLYFLLKNRDELEEAPDVTLPTDKQVEDRKTLKLAMSYITDADSPPPVKSEGLDLISGLIVTNSPALDIPAVLVLLSSLLNDVDDFINLRVIKMYVQLANKHPKTVCREILDHYLDPGERSSTDTRLKFGEALVQVVERLGAVFAGEVAIQVSETLLSIAGRRGYRPRTMARQEREERMRQRKNKEAEDAWGGDVPDMSDDITEEERANSEILARILEGWESKRGSEDVRMRASALSIFSSALESNIAGIGPTLVSAAIDLCINVLALESELEKGILRRAAIIVVLEFVRALDNARQHKMRLGFGLTEESRKDILRTLQYIESTDNDALVQQHSRDVIESLENWQIRSLLPEAARMESGLERLVGLKVDPNRGQIGNAGGTPSRRPKIEEVE